MTAIHSRADLARVLKPLEVIHAVEEGFVAYSRGQVVVPPVGHLEFKNPPGDCHIKYGYIRGDDTFTVKLATGFYENPSRGLSSSNGAVLVWSSRTGELLTILQDEGLLTDLRTAAAGAVAAKYLAPRTIDCIGIIGTGIQAKLQLEYLGYVSSCRRTILWGRSVERARSVRVHGFDITVVSSVAELASRSQLIVTTTPSAHWLLDADSVQPGTHVTAVGADSPGKQELDPRLFSRARICVVDSRAQCVAHGDTSHAIRAGFLQEKDLIELGDIIVDPKRGRQSQTDITIADLTGVAVQDIQIAKLTLRALQ
jgi:ornithine cyclodeaminase